MLVLILWSTLGSFLRVAIVSFISAYGTLPEYIALFYAQILGILCYSLVSKPENYNATTSQNANSPNVTTSQNAPSIPSNSQSPTQPVPQNHYLSLDMKDSFLVGFCGSLTTFSTFMTDIWALVFGGIAKGTGGNDIGYSIFCILSMLISMVSIMHLFYSDFDEKIVRILGRRWWESKRATILMLLLLNIICFAVSGVAASINSSPLWLILLLSPVGSIVRYWIAVICSTSPVLFIRTKGTLTANLIATTIASILIITSPSNCTVQIAFLKGFCGCLSTLSTLTKEWFAFGNGHLFLSLISGLCISFTIFAGGYFTSLWNPLNITNCKSVPLFLSD